MSTVYFLETALRWFFVGNINYTDDNSGVYIADLVQTGLDKSRLKNLGVNLVNITKEVTCRIGDLEC